MACKPESSPYIQVLDESVAVCKSFILCQERLQQLRQSRVVPYGWNDFSKDEKSEHFRQWFTKLMTIWENYVHDLLKETVEVVFDHVSSPNVVQDIQARVHFQNILEKALLHHSSHAISDSEQNHGKTKHENSDLEKIRKLEVGAAGMSARLLPQPHLWKSHFDRYKQTLLTRCDQVTPVFRGKDGIDCALESILDAQKALSVVIVEMGTIKFWFRCRKDDCTLKLPVKQSYRGKEDNCTLELSTSEGICDLLRLYHSIYCIFTDVHPEAFDQLDGELFGSPTKENFQKVFGEIPGDYLHLRYHYVRQYRKTAWICANNNINLNRFIQVLARYVCDAISRIVHDKFGIRIWHKTQDYCEQSNAAVCSDDMMEQM